MDELKKHIQLHRAELDTDEPAEMSWSSIKTTTQPVVHKMYLRWVVAASLVLTIGAVAYFLPEKDTKEAISSLHVDHHWDIRVVTNKKDTSTVVMTADKQTDPVQRQDDMIKKKKRRIQAPPPVYGFEGVEASYAAMLDLQRERLRKQPIYGENAAYFDLFKKQFATLAEEEEQVKQRVRKTGMQDEHLDELISIYQEKINVLKQLQFEINRINTRTKQADPNVNTRPPAYINL
jgi:hypothetical protein